MFNSRVSILPIFLALVLIYLIIGECLLLKLFLSALGLFLLYINFLPSKQAACRKDNCVVSPVDGEITAIDYSDEAAVITIRTKLYNRAMVTVPKNGYVETKHIHGLNMGLQSKLAKKLNQKIIYSYDDLSMQMVPQYFEADNYLDSDRYFIGDVMGRIFCGEVIITLKGYDIKAVASDKVKAKTTILAYKNEQ